MIRRSFVSWWAMRTGGCLQVPGMTMTLPDTLPVAAWACRVGSSASGTRSATATRSSPRSTRSTSSESWRASLRTYMSIARTPRDSSPGAGIHTVVLTTTPPGAHDSDHRLERVGGDWGEVEQHVDRLGHRRGYV